MLNDILIDLLFTHRADFERIPDELIPVVRRIVSLAVAAQRERDAQIAGSFLDTKRILNDDVSINYHAGFIDGALNVREAIRAQSTLSQSPDTQPPGTS